MNKEKITKYLKESTGKKQIEPMYRNLAWLFSAHYVCKDESCPARHVVIARDAATLQEAGDPYCGTCDGETEAANDLI